MTITIEMLQQRNKALVMVSNLTGVPVDDIMSPARTDKVAMARHLVVWVLVTILDYSPTIVAVLLRLHRTSVIYGRQKILRMGRKLPSKEVEEFKKQLENYFVKL